MITLPNNAALILVDVQKAFDDPCWGERSHPEAEGNIAKLLARWRSAGRPLFHVRHDSTEPNSTLRPERPGNAFKPEAMPEPGEPVIGKNVNSAFIGTDLEARLRAQHIDTVVLCGFTANHCVSTTTRMAGNLGFRAFVVSDSTVAYAMKSPSTGRMIPAAQMHEVGMAELHDEFATVVTTEEILARI